ncbi:hypothetical protein C8Q75DRAFT_810486 [Abortiporus biennis]|nr:hypothetical protein C8Q75DRAFT_810486 [Abortiporus biennis]
MLKLSVTGNRWHHWHPVDDFQPTSIFINFLSEHCSEFCTSFPIAESDDTQLPSILLGYNTALQHHMCSSQSPRVIQAIFLAFHISSALLVDPTAKLQYRKELVADGTDPEAKGQLVIPTDWFNSIFEWTGLTKESANNAPQLKGSILRWIFEE